MTSIKKVKYKYLRLRIKWRNWRRSVGDKMVSERSKITAYEEKALRLWKLLLRDEDTKMSFNTYGVRQIEKKNVFMKLQAGGSSTDCIMTLIDITSERRSLYEIHIPTSHAEIICDQFDYELEKRMKKAENNKRILIETDIDNLLEQEEKLVLEKMAAKINR
jgi:hypothetical protein